MTGSVVGGSAGRGASSRAVAIVRQPSAQAPKRPAVDIGQLHHWRAIGQKGGQRARIFRHCVLGGLGGIECRHLDLISGDQRPAVISRRDWAFATRTAHWGRFASVGGCPRARDDWPRRTVPTIADGRSSDPPGRCGDRAGHALKSGPPACDSVACRPLSHRSGSARDKHRSVTE
jgi:hypothetical protein